MRIEHGLLPGHVLQRTARGATVAITGTCDDPACACPVTATVRKGSKALPKLKGITVGASAQGHFTATLRGLPAGGPYSVELACGRERVQVDEVYVGDLWLMAGQSNMEGVGDMVDAHEPHPMVRCFTMARRWEQARDPLHFLPESPDRVHGGGGLDAKAAAAGKRKALKGVGVGIPFARLLHARTKVPQGLISTAHGGTSMAQWDPVLKDRGGDSLYGSMTLSLQAVGQPVAGVLWYQGCSDTTAEQAKVYTAKMQELVAAVRRDLGQPRLPWVIVQIGRVVEPGKPFAEWNDIQEQQRRLPETIPQCDVVPAIDLDLDDLIHVSAKAYPILADRMARVAARLVLGDRSEKPALQPVSARFLEPAKGRSMGVEVRFANVVGGLVSAGLARGFSAVDREGRHLDVIHKTVLEGDRAKVYLTGAGSTVVGIGYGRGVDPVCTVQDARGMGVPVFAPIPVTGIPAITSWFLHWRITPIRPGEDIAGMPRPSAEDAESSDRTFVPEFVNLHPEWEGKTGHVGFTGAIEVEEAMEVEVRFGYDGPIRLWIGDREIHTDMQGTNPAIRDAQRIPLSLTPGRHPVSVLMALNQGRAWGFFLRMYRPGVDPATGPSMPRLL